MGKVINLQQWAKDNEQKQKDAKRQRLLKQILERGNPLDKK